MGRTNLYTCDKCERQTVEAEMGAVWKHLEWANDDWWFCPECSGKVDRLITEFVSQDDD